MISNRELREIEFCTLTAESVFVGRLEEKAAENPADPEKRYFCQYCGKEIVGVKRADIAYCSIPCAHRGREKAYRESKRKWGEGAIAVDFYLGEIIDEDD